MSSPIRVEGHSIERRATFIGADGRHFVARSTGRGRSWLRFLQRFDATGYYVTAHRTRRDAIHDFTRGAFEPLLCAGCLVG